MEEREISVRELKLQRYKKKKREQLIKKVCFIATVLAVLIAVIVLIAVLSAGKKETAIKPNGEITVKQDYKISGLFIETLSDKAITDGWKYYYVETADDGAALKDWISPKDGVAVELSVDITNLAKEEVNFTERVSCKLIYNDTQEISTTVMQENPEQKSENGEVCRSIISVPVESGKTVKIWFMSDIPLDYRDSDLPFKALITIDENIYTVDLRNSMKVF